MEEKGKKRFSLVLEPHGSYEKYVLVFNQKEDRTYTFTKVPFKTCEEISKFNKGKYLLSDIDMFVSKNFDDDYDMFRQLGLYQRVHNIYIQYSNSGQLKRLPLIYDEVLASGRLCYVVEDRIVNNYLIKHFFNQLIDNNKFFVSYLKYDNTKTKGVEHLVKEAVWTGRYMQKVEASMNDREYFEIISEKVQKEFSKYHIFRGLVLAEQKMLEREDEIKQKSINFDNEDKVLQKKLVYPGYSPKEYKQITMNEFDD